jgi:hypothetical protein
VRHFNVKWTPAASHKCPEQLGCTAPSAVPCEFFTLFQLYRRCDRGSVTMSSDSSPQARARARRWAFRGLTQRPQFTDWTPRTSLSPCPLPSSQAFYTFISCISVSKSHLWVSSFPAQSRPTSQFPCINAWITTQPGAQPPNLSVYQELLFSLSWYLEGPSWISTERSRVQCNHTTR